MRKKRGYRGRSSRRRAPSEVEPFGHGLPNSAKFPRVASSLLEGAIRQGSFNRCPSIRGLTGCHARRYDIS
jgi:hypothetical protein